MHPSLRRVSLVAAPALTLLVVGAGSWVLTSRDETGWGPMRALPYSAPPPAEAVSADLSAPPPTLLERLTPVQAEIRNSLLPFSTAPLLNGASYRPMGEASASALQCLTAAVYYEAGNEPEAGKRAVAQVVLNRAASPAFPHTICGVVQQGATRPGCQFTFMCDGSLSRTPAAASWMAAQTVARAALAGVVDPDVGSATHYHADYVVPIWAPTMIKLVKIGHHIFYRWPGAHLDSVLVTPIPADAANTTADDQSTTAAAALTTPATPSTSDTSSFRSPSAAPLPSATPLATAMPATPQPETATSLSPPPQTSQAPEKTKQAPRRAVPQQTLRTGPF